MGENDFSRALGGIYDRLTKIETLMEAQHRAEQTSSLGPRVQKLEIEIATMRGKMLGIGAAAGLAVSIIFKFI